MFNKAYLKAWIEAHKKRNNIMKKQESQIKRLYKTLVFFILKFISKFGKDMSKTQLDKLKIEILKKQKEIEENIPKIIKDNAKSAKDIVINLEGDKEKLKDPFDEAIQRVLNGSIYKDKLPIKERIKKYSSKLSNDIETIIEVGAKKGLSSYDIAKEIEKYIDPDKLKPWDWSNVYPGVNKKVDYTAQRLARTTLNHIWQEYVKESARRNTFITHVEWRSSLMHGRTCKQCRKRHGKRYLIDKVPYDHPNGLCVLIPVTDKSLEEIAITLRQNI